MTLPRCVLCLLLLCVSCLAHAQPVPAGGTAPTPTARGDRPTIGAADTPGTMQTTVGACAAAAPDAEYLIPRQFSVRTEASKDGGYGFLKPAACNYWIVDFLLNRYSNERITEDGMVLHDPVIFAGDAYDLPSSAQHNGSRPIVEEDCRKLEIDVLVYRKDPDSNTFTLLSRSQGRFASWNAGNRSCSISALQARTETAPHANITKIRIATRVKLRGTWQQAAGLAYLAPPN